MYLKIYSRDVAKSEIVMIKHIVACILAALPNVTHD